MIIWLIIAVVGVFFLIPFIDGWTGKHRFAKLYGVTNEECAIVKGVYLTSSQVQKLKQKEELPIVNTPIFLRNGEIAVYYSKATRLEIKQRNTTANYIGELVITTNRVVFLSEQKGFELLHHHITAATAKKMFFLCKAKTFLISCSYLV